MLKKIEAMCDRLLTIVTIEKNYTMLFRASIALIALWLIALGQGFPVLYGIERDAYKLRYDLEARFKTDLQKIDCTKMPVMEADCKFAKYQMKAAENGVELLDQVMQSVLCVGLVLGVMSILGFLLDLDKATKIVSPKFGASEASGILKMHKRRRASRGVYFIEMVEKTKAD